MSFILFVFFSLCVGFSYMQTSFLENIVSEKAETHKPLKWIETQLIWLPESGEPFAGEPVGKYILPYQRDIITAGFLPSGRPGKNIFIGFSRKISKSTIASWMITYALLNWKGARIITLASTYSQAGPVYDSVKAQLQFSKPLSNVKKKIRKDYIEILHKQTRLQKIFSRSDSNLGMIGVSLVVADELGAHDSPENLNAIETGMGLSRVKPLKIYLSNPPKEPTHWSVNFFKNLREDPGTKFFDFSMPQNAKLDDRSAWSIANPIYAHYRKTKDPLYKNLSNFLESEYIKATKDREAEQKFRRFLLGQRVFSEANRLCNPEHLQVITTDDIFSDKNIRWCLGCDLSWTWDFTSFALVGFSQDNNSLFLKDFSFLANLDGRFPAQKVQFQKWAEQGFFTLYNKKTLPRDRVIESVKNFISAKKIKLEKILTDNALSKSWNLDREWPQLESIWMSPRAMAGPLRFLQKTIKAEKLFLIGDNDFVKWAFGCALISEKSTNFCTAFKQSKFSAIDPVDSASLAVKHLSENRKKKFNFFITSKT